MLFRSDVHVRIAFDAAGRPLGDAARIERTVLRADPGVDPSRKLESALRRRFESVVERSFGDWRWTPDEVDGVPVAGEFRMVVGFPSARASRLGEVVAEDADTRFFARPAPGLAMPVLEPWSPAVAAAAPAR